MVKELREKTGAGMMDCKKALAANNNDMDAATEWLRKKGLASADKKAGRLAAEGVVAAYVHPGSRLGVLIEVNCETDFVAVSDKFQQLVSTISMQIAASPSVGARRGGALGCAARGRMPACPARPGLLLARRALAAVLCATLTHAHPPRRAGRLRVGRGHPRGGV